MIRPSAIAGIAAALILASAIVWVGSASSPAIQGDANCDAVVDARDALSLLQEMAGFTTPAGACAGKTDTDCDGDSDGNDVLAILVYASQQADATTQSQGCVPIGSPIETTPTSTGLPTPSPSFTSTPTPTASASPTLAPTPTPTATPTGPTPTPTITPLATLGPCPESETLPSGEVGAAGGPAPNGYALRKLPASADIDRMTSLTLVPNEPGFAMVTTENGYVYKICLTAPGRKEMANFSSFVRDFEGSDDTNEGMTSLDFDPLDPSIVYVVYSYPKDGPHLVIGETPGPNTTRSRISRFHIVDGAIDPSTEEVLLEIFEPNTSHNASQAIFGPDGMLYIGAGDGLHRPFGQTTDDFWGSILRIDVHSGSPYSIPPGNPLADGPGGNADEIWAYGFRNPWRFTFDNGVMWLGDVGSSTYEEVNIGAAGLNYGWPVMEGFVCFPGVAGPTPTPGPTCNTAGYTTPRTVYSHDTDGCAVIGGYVYHGSEMPELDGYYIYGDHCTGRIWGIDTSDDQSPPVVLADSVLHPTSWAVTSEGEVIAVNYRNDLFTGVAGIYQLERLP